MGYVFNSAQLKMIMQSIANTYDECLKLTEDAQNKLKLLYASGSMKGPGTDRLFAYLSDVHVTSIQRMLVSFADIILSCCRDYYANYYKNVDEQCDALIDTEELLDIQQQLRSLCHMGTGSYYAIESAMNSTMRKAAGATQQHYSGLPLDIPTEFDVADQKLQEIVDSIDLIEKTYQPQIANVITSIQNLQQLFLRPCFGISIEKYSQKAFFSDPAWVTFYQSISTVAEHYEKWLANAEQTNQALTSLQEQWDERAAKAELLKLGISLFTNITATVVTVALPGAGIFVGAAIKGTADAFSSAIGEGIDQWANGSAAANGGLDYASILYKGGTAGLKGFTSNLVGGYFGELADGAGVVKKIGLEFAKNYTNEIIDDGFELLDAYKEGELLETFEEMTSDETAVERFGKVVTASISDVVVDDGLDKLLGLDGSKGKPPSSFSKYAQKFIGSGCKQVVGGKLEKARDAAIDELIVTSDDGGIQFDWLNGTDTFATSILSDHDDVMNDFLQGGANELATEIVKDNDLYDKRMSRILRNNDALKDDQGRSKYHSYHSTPDGTVVIEGTADRERTDVTDTTYVNTQKRTTITVSQNKHGSDLFTVTETTDRRVRGTTSSGDVKVQEHIREQISTTHKTQNSGRTSYQTTTQIDDNPIEKGKSLAADKAALKQRKADYKIIKEVQARQDRAISSITESLTSTARSIFEPDEETKAAMPTSHVPVTDNISKLKQLILQ